MTRAPFFSDDAAFSAMSCQQTTSKKLTFSSHSPVERFCQRRFTATPRRAWAWPLGVKRSSGSRVTFPTMVMLLPDISSLFSLSDLRRGCRPRRRLESDVGDADHLVADDLVGKG